MPIFGINTLKFNNICEKKYFPDIGIAIESSPRKNKATRKRQKCLYIQKLHSQMIFISEILTVKIKHDVDYGPEWPYIINILNRNFVGVIQTYGTFPCATYGANVYIQAVANSTAPLPSLDAPVQYKAFK